MELNPDFSYIYPRTKNSNVVLLYGKQHTEWVFHSQYPKAFTCAVTGLKYFADGPCYTSSEAPGVLISGEGVARLQEKAFYFFK
ncbi:hypothetical protein GCM10027348_31400 [Hymenobacter tenuis]